MTGLRSDPATRDTTASRYLETAINYWQAKVTAYDTYAAYALDRATSTHIEQAEANVDAAYAADERATCDLWRLQQYTNAEEVCTTPTPTQGPTAEEIDALAARIVQRWNETLTPLRDLADQWNAIQGYETRPSSRLWGIAQQQASHANGMVNFLQSESSDPALAHEVVANWWTSALARWSAYALAFEAYEEYALATVDLETVQQKNSASDAASSRAQRAKCDLWRLQDYSNAEEVCATAGQ